MGRYKVVFLFFPLGQNIIGQNIIFVQPSDQSHKLLSYFQELHVIIDSQLFARLHMRTPILTVQETSGGGSFQAHLPYQI